MTCSASITVELVDQILKRRLASLFEDLGRRHWYHRERDVVNLFVFGHLLPEFQHRGLDPTLIAIECPVVQAIKESAKGKLGVCKDVVIWREPGTTRFRDCTINLPLDEAYLRERAIKPLAILEWKNRSLLNPKHNPARGLRCDDVWLRQNLKAKMMDVGYSIFVDQVDELKLVCKRYGHEAQGIDFVVLATAKSAVHGHVT